jgi:parvulin-like peptidyl-prolyl isomerase
MPARLLRRLAPLLALLAVVASACGSAESKAATVNGTVITASSLQDELQAIKANPAYRKALEDPQNGYGMSLTGSGKGTFNTEFAAQTLTLRVYYDLIERDLAKRGVKITAKDDKDARTTIKSGIDQLGKGVWAKFPADYQTRLAHQTAIIAKAQDQAGKDLKPTKAQVACVSHILIAVSDTVTDAQAKAKIEDLKRQLDAGADFATLAKANSDDGSKAQGGDLGCQPEGTYVAEFEQAVQTLPLNKVSDPVKTQFGYHLIVVHSRGEQTVQPDQTASQQAFSDYLLKLMCGAKTKVTVDPKYGTWDKAPCKGDQGLAKVTAPKKPATSKK